MFIILISISWAFNPNILNNLGKRGSEVSIHKDISEDMEEAIYHVNPGLNEFLSPDESFEWTVNCPLIVDSTFCDDAKVSLQSAGKRIAEQIMFRIPVKVAASFKTIRDAVDVVATGGPASFWGAKEMTSKSDASIELVYPQALLKQSNVINNHIAPLNAFDIHIEFNMNFAFNVKPNQISIPRKFIDLEFVTAHELMHGLGFFSGLTIIKGDSRMSSGLAASSLYEFTSGIIQHAPPCVLDSLLYGNGDQSAANILTANTAGFWGKVAGPTQSNKPTVSAMKRLYKTLTRETLYYKLGDGTNLKLHQEQGQFRPPAHVDPIYNEGPEFLMTLGNGRGLTLNNVMDDGNFSAVLGPSTLKVMEKLGYATRNNNHMLQLLITNPDWAAE